MKYLLLSLFAFIATSSFSQTGEKNFIDQNYIEVTGTAELEIVPDLIYMAITINEKDSKNKISLPEQEKLLTNKLSEIGIDVSKDLLVKDMSSDFKNSLLLKMGVLLSKEYQVIVRDPKNVNKIFTELEKVGISNINIDRLDHTEIIQYRKDVKIMAIRSAKEKAGYLTEAIGQTIGRAIFIQENIYSPRPNTNISANAMYAVHRGAPESDMDVVEFEKIKLSFSVLCRFELK